MTGWKSRRNAREIPERTHFISSQHEPLELAFVPAFDHHHLLEILGLQEYNMTSQMIPEELIISLE